ncbi:aldehyde dehydrogenase family protein [Sphingomonas sp. CGMCC 1.13654]|uniref:Aldehyde dehydrogenase family protein n=1 Tax=Sphingomonas chungangi TaxID=2683589 RepID=A0A838L1E4_9SPHN|nr:aldehyde dehydrogenase family protein [Sphingomonas chungangi]MBA2932475.1 aldehyde dehydrogenase family protein [Sphingomonas chungangi]MVW56098.1 aldehyde dehydrogenase family protein [Sphingomonas chungangi]
MKYRMLIDGKLREGASTLDVVDPATGAPFETCARADQAQLEEAVAAAKRSFPAWAALPQAERRSYLDRLADAMETRLDEFCALLTREQGKPLAQSQFEIGGSVLAIRTLAAMTVEPQVLRDTDTDLIIEHRTPLGVIGAITPWNFPVILLIYKMVPALVMGNTVVAKPAPTTPLTTMLLGELCAGILPAGVFNVVVDNNDLGAALSAHPDVAKISFTGSTATGRRVMAAAATNLKRLTLELGGNDAAIILDDADVKVVAQKVFDAAMVNAGQTCLAAKRIYAPHHMVDALCDEFARIGRETVVDAGQNQGAQIGPVQNRQQYERVLELIDDAKQHGTVVVGGGAMDRDGYFIQPTVMRDLSESVRLVREEQFGPVFPVLGYDTIDEVVARANDSDFGLGASIWTADPKRGTEIAMRIDTGTTWVNKHLDTPFDVPFGGVKQSGLGRELGIEGVKEFTQVKIVNVAK